MRRQKLASLFITHPDDDHTSLLRIPHHGSLLKASAVGPSVLSYFDESGVSPFTPPRSAEYLLLCLLPRKNREYFMGCLEEEFRTVLLPKYGEFWARVYYWSQAIQSLASVGWGLIKKTGISGGHLESSALKVASPLGHSVKTSVRKIKHHKTRPANLPSVRLFCSAMLLTL